MSVNVNGIMYTYKCSCLYVFARMDTSKGNNLVWILWHIPDIVQLSDGF